jgi:predicted transcriptional regulator
MTGIANLAEFREALDGTDDHLKLFHMVNRILPEGQVIVRVPPETLVCDALALMKEHGYSQLPVTQGNSVLGVFTFRAFALEVAQIGNAKVDIQSLSVEEFLDHEKPVYANLTDEFKNLIEVLDEKDYVVVSGSENLVAILTPMDVLNYLHSVSDAFVLMEEIELALRFLISFAIPDADIFRICIENALKQKNLDIPERLEDFTFGQYVSLLGDGRNWNYFQNTFGGTRERTRAKLEPIRLLRNDVFHFRRELQLEDREKLANCRNWLARCTRKVNARGRIAQ